jgi:hypothetical protein
MKEVEEDLFLLFPLIILTVVIDFKWLDETVKDGLDEKWSNRNKVVFYGVYCGFQFGLFGFKY